MDVSTLPIAYLIAGAAGIASHLFYFRIGEHHMLGAVYLQLFVLTCVGGTIALARALDASTYDALRAIIALASCWLLGLYSSLIVYRGFFHPLNHFPGPWQAKIGDLWLSSRLTGLNAYSVLHSLHQEYGRYVRIGSNTLSISDPDIMQPTYGLHARATKSDWYDSAYPHHSMHTVRDKGLHDRRRRVWAPAFSDKALKEYESTVNELNESMVRRLGDYEGGPVNMQLLFSLYGFDVMGRLAFGKDYGMLQTGHLHWALDILAEGLKIGGLRLPTWVMRILIEIPGAAAGHNKFLKFCSDELKWRVNKGKGFGGKDITEWLLKAYSNEKNPEDDHMLQGDSRLIIVAGGDTTAAVLTYLFYYLALDPNLQKRLRAELLPVTTGMDWTDKDLKHLNHLNGTINETLRLHPPVSSGVMRNAPAEGLQIGESFIPGNTTFSVPQYSMGRGIRSNNEE
ncbi:Cytochrome P450 monooxygenase [Pseudocercospora fuligena]|uniref:Cytochrome P450 monooxygenase n=1 Tax=Pseudocercospora fuligena TaxID=685502 RepID=A0A8H6R8Z6_9PEZI|nr:Cytochrome P450 monooxygenase [Pseudocercospora fuligena]